MRVRVLAAGATVLLMAACSRGDGGGGGRAAPTTAATSTTLAPATSTTLAPVTSTTAAAGDPAGSTTLSAAGVTLPDTRSGGGGLRLLVRPAPGRVTVRRRGGGGAVTACPAVDVAGPAGPGGCADLEAGRAVELAAWGVDLRATAGPVTVDEVSLTYVPADPSVTLVTPARWAGSCGPARPCQARFSLSPAHAGTFSLDGRAGVGRPRLTLSSNRGPGGSISTLVTVEGGGNLSIRATLDGTSEATLAYAEESAEAVPALTLEILWP